MIVIIYSIRIYGSAVSQIVHPYVRYSSNKLNLNAHLHSPVVL